MEPSTYQDCTLSPKIAFRFGDLPFFAMVLNEISNSSQPLFVKYKSSPTSYTWTKIRFVSEASSTYQWNGKSYLVRFELENGVTIGLESVSSKAVDQLDIDTYLTTSGGGSLPTLEAIQKTKEKLISGIIHRKISDEDKSLLVEYNTRLSKFVGNAAVQHTVTMLENMRSETEAGVSSSFHECGFSTRAQQRRLADCAPSSDLLGLSPSSASLSQMHSASQGSNESMIISRQETQVAATIDPSVAEANRARWMAALEAEENFTRYASQPERVAFVARLASKTKDNKVLNAIATLKALETASDTKKGSNMVESTGLWITDDGDRHRIASDHRAKQEGGTSEKKEDKAKKPAPGAAVPGVQLGNPDTSAPSASGSASTAASLSQEFDESVPDTLLDDIAVLASQVTSEPTTPSRVPLHRSPSMLQLQSRYASMVGRSSDEGACVSPAGASSASRKRDRGDE